MIGQRLGHYLVEQKLGAGGMAVVYKGRDLRLNKTVAIKLLPDAVMEKGQEFAERFIREAQAAARIEHTNVLPVYFIGAENERLFIAMQYVDGGTLEELLKRQGRLEPMEATRLVREVALALAAAHAHRIIHRDIKPSNVMLMKDGHVLVADFGLAKSGEATTMLTSSGVIMGTPAYMSPEQGSALPVDARSDLYSLGVMYYQLVTGKLPYVADNPLVIINQHVNAPVPDPRALVPDLNENIRASILWLMAKRPEERFQSASDLVQNLNVILGLPQYAGLPSMVATPVSAAPAVAQAIAPQQPALSKAEGVRGQSSGTAQPPAVPSAVAPPPAAPPPTPGQPAPAVAPAPAAAPSPGVIQHPAVAKESAESAKS
ncbi:MAG: serine/threonine-protein kinase, partial [Chloroflexi bacterium]|nr:serine/threonine-protein kinase [Chloroflexota bacterium]